MNAHIAKSIQAKPELVQISTAYGQQKEGSAVLPRNKYIVIRDDRPRSKEEAKRSERHGRHQRQSRADNAMVSQAATALTCMP